MRTSAAFITAFAAAGMALSGASLLAGIPLPAPAKKAAGSNQSAADQSPDKGESAKAINQLAEGRVELSQSGLSLVPPTGWTIKDNLPGMSLVFESPEEKDSRYRRTLQVRTGTGPRFFDSLGIKDFEDELVEKLGNQNDNVNEFSIRNSEVVKTDDGRDALLTYASFSLNGFEMIQAHLVLSNMEQHTVITYTDLADNFTDNSTTSPLGLAWAAMSSARFPGKQPDRFAGPIQFAALAGIALVILAVIVSVRNAMARKALAREADLALNGKTIESGEASSNPGNFLSGDAVTLNQSPSNLSGEQPVSLQTMEKNLDKVA